MAFVSLARVAGSRTTWIYFLCQKSFSFLLQAFRLAAAFYKLEILSRVTEKIHYKKFFAFRRIACP